MDKVKLFIEEHIDELDDPDAYSDIYFAAYDEFSNSEFAEFNTIMHDALGINVSEYQDKVLRYIYYQGSLKTGHLLQKQVRFHCRCFSLSIS